MDGLKMKPADTKECVSEEKQLTPHTLRLLRLITNSSSNAKSAKESTQRAIFLLGRIASRSDPVILWDILARLNTSLSSPDESDALGSGVIRRNTISLAMEHIAKYIPIGDQRNFLMEDHDDNDASEAGVDKNGGLNSQGRGIDRQWLTVQDFCDDDTINLRILDQVLDKGRLLLSCGASTFDNASESVSEFDREMSVLAKLDASISGSDKPHALSMNKFIKERIELQRNILAKRLGLGGIFSRDMAQDCHSDLLNSMVSNEDLVKLPAALTSSSRISVTGDDSKKQFKCARDRNLARLKKRQKIESKEENVDPNDESQNNNEHSAIRRILLLSIDYDRNSQKINSNSTRLLSHKTPQSLLATDLIFHSFHPSWHIRHGSLLGLLALLRAWRLSFLQSQDKVVGGHSSSGTPPTTIFGKWPQDILCRCICIIILDRFGDHAGPLTENSRDETEISLQSSAIAPVRDAAAQVISLLIEMAPIETIQHPCFQILRDLFLRNVPWEVRHGAMLSLKYISGLKDKHDAPTFSRFGGNVLTSVFHSVVIGMKDSSDDVKSACAQTASNLIYCKSYGVDENCLLRTFVSQCSENLWSAICHVRATSSCVLDLLQCLCDLVQYDCKIVLSAVSSSALRSSPMEELLKKLGNLMQFHSISIRTYSLRTLSIIADPLASAIFAGNGGVSRGEFDEKRTSVMFGSILKVYCGLVSDVFGLFLADGVYDDQSHQCIDDDTIAGEMDDSQFESTYISERIGAWNALSEAIKHFLSSHADINDKVLGGVIRENIVHLMTRYLNFTSHSTESRHMIYKIDSKLDQYNCQVIAADALVRYCTCVVPQVEGIHQYLTITITALLRSPWIEHCELACIILQCIGSSHQPSKFLSVLEHCHLPLLDILEQIPICLQLNTIAKIDSIRNDTLKDLCESSMVTVFRNFDLSQPFAYEDVKSSIFRTWSSLYKNRGIDLQNIQTGDLNTAPIAKMRLNAAIAGSVVCLGPSLLPGKMTAVIRSLVTLIKNETSLSRSRISSELLAKLIRYLRISTHERHGKVMEKILENICEMAIAPVNHGLGHTSRGSEQAKEIIKMVVAEVPDDVTLAEVRPIWDRLQPLTNPDPAKFNDSLVSQALTLLCSVSSALRMGSSSLSNASSFILPTVSLLACKSPSAQIRHDAVHAINDFCRIDVDLSLPMVLPYLDKFMNAFDDDPSRLGSCTLLNAIVRSHGISLCPYISFLLPACMSTMTDALRSAAKISASTFSHLVRLAPLVHQGGENNVIQNTSFSEWGDDSKEVVDHLILGKPLPPCKTSSIVESCLNKSGINLRNYQTEGISWMHFLRKTGLNGALCDDMGLGKTIQAIIAIASAHDQQRALNKMAKPKSLVVCPSSLLMQWKNEVEKAGFGQETMNVLQLAGSKRQAKWTQDFQVCDLVVTSYQVLRSDIKLLMSYNWTYCVLDEGHLLKNPKTLTAKAARRLRSQHRLLLSGTPIQNNVHELWSAFDWLMPNYLGNEKEFSSEYGRFITKGNLPGASSKEIRIGIEKLKQLHQKVLPFILRRKKSDVLRELPAKVITDIPCAMTEYQQDNYAKFLTVKETMKALELLESIFHNDSATRMNNNNDQNVQKQHVLKSLLSLRLICTHPILVLDKRHAEDYDSVRRFDTSGKLMALNDLLRRSKIFHDEITGADNDKSLLYLEDHDIDGTVSSDTIDCNASYHIFEQGAVENDISSSPKCLIFAQYTQSLDIVEDLLLKPLMPSLHYVRIDGKTSIKDRVEIVESFEKDPDIKCMLLTSKVGSLGLNLQAADTVIFLENDWNPFVDLQAMDRSHRIGQKHNVKVYRLITKDSIEEKIMTMQKVKFAMSDAVVNTENSTMYSMGTDRLLDLFSTEN